MRFDVGITPSLPERSPDIRTSAPRAPTFTLEARAEFDRQLDTLVGVGFPQPAGLSEAAFRDRIGPLASHVETLSGSRDDGRVPFLIVVGRELVSSATAITLVALRGKPGFTTMEPADLERFRPIDGVEATASAYLVTDVDAGVATRNVTPDAALPGIIGAGRSPLTVEEGIALVAQHPEILRRETCFSVLGSRCGDRRVPALWVSGGRPRLGWCWAGNPHTWLGSASCGRRSVAT